MLAAESGHSDIVKVLLEAGAAIEVKTTVSKRISIFTCPCVCVCVCVIFLHHSVWYVGYDDFISMNIVFVFIFIISLLVLLLTSMKIDIFEKSLFLISSWFFYFYLFLYIVYFVSPLCTYFWWSYYFCFSLFWCLYFPSNSLLISFTLSHLIILLDLIWFIA